jgi:hypothetical protein
MVLPEMGALSKQTYAFLGLVMLFLSIHTVS